MEILKDIIGYEGEYQISNLGRVWSLKRNRFLLPDITGRGYYKVCLCKSNIKKGCCVHKYVAKHFIPNPENKPCVNHKDGNKLNNHIDNLEWCTVKENCQHAWRIGLQKDVGQIKAMTLFNKTKRVFNGVMVLDTKSGIIYNTIKEASLKTGLSERFISTNISGVTKVNKTNLIKYNHGKETNN